MQKTAEKVLDTFADHFYGPGAIPWHGLYFCEQNRNNIGQTSNFNIILIDDNIIRNIFRTYSKNSNTPNMFENMLLCIKH